MKYRNFFYTCFTLIVSWVFVDQLSAQRSISGPNCAVKSGYATYSVSGGSASSMTWCASGGTIVGASGSCLASGTYYSVTVLWANGTTGSISLSTSGPSSSSSLSVTLINQVSGGTISNNSQSILYNGTPANLTCSAATGGSCGTATYNYQWESSVDQVSWTDVTGATNQDLSFSNFLSQTTYYRRKVSVSNPTSTGYSNIAEVLVSPQLLGGTVTGSTTINNGSSPGQLSNSVVASGGSCNGVYTYTWQQSTDNINYVAISNATTLAYSPPVLTQLTYFRRRVICNTEVAYSNVLTIQVSPPLLPGSITPNLFTLAANTAPGLMSGSSASGGNCNNSFSYQWQSSTDGNTWADISSASNVNYTSGSLAVTTYFRRKVVCGSDFKYSNIATAIVDGGTNDLNYIVERLFEKPGITDLATANAITTTHDVRQSTQYMDGIGRPIQTVAQKAATGEKDMVLINVYDNLGREIRKYLPYVATTSDGLYKATYQLDQLTFNQAQFPNEQYYYIETVSEPSPLNRTITTFAPGISWVGSSRGVGNGYELNASSDDVRIWTVGNTIGSIPTTTASYAADLLYKSILTDEHGKKVVEFKDMQGKLILKKVQISNSAPTSSYVGWLCTYYVYDAMDNLRVVIQPEGTNYGYYYGWNLTATHLDEQCFQYEYDGRKRMIAKKVPGAKIVNMVYNVRDQLLLMQDGKMKVEQKWLYTTYDELNRPVVAGLLNDPVNYNNPSYHRNAAANAVSYPNFANYTDEELTRTFYDNYDWLWSFGTPASPTWEPAYSDHLITPTGNYPYAQAMVQATSVIGMVTGVRKKVLGSAGTYLYETTHYNDKMAVMQTDTYHSTGARTYQTSQYDFAGKLLRQLTWNDVQFDGFKVDFRRANYQYDDLARLAYTSIEQYRYLGTWYASGERWTTRFEYDALGRIKKKILGPVPAQGNGIESQEFDYNVRGWLLGMNRDYAKDANNNNFFGFDLGYDKTSNGLVGNQSYAAAQYNGNISGTVWKSKGDGEKRKYDFTYDAANRILTADFNQYTGGNFNKTANLDFSMSNLSYDLNGNIQSMNHKGWKFSGSSVNDQLTYNYFPYSNKLNYVTDGMNDPNSTLGDFKEITANNSNDYGYDDNGNMNRDENKGISSITYNYLNLPSVITITNKGTITYEYDATGQKLKKTTVDNTVTPSKTTVTDYIGNGVYENNQLQLIQFDEGRIRFNETAHTFAFDYFLKDHLGNVRSVITDETKTDAYPAATMEANNASVEQEIYSNITNTQSDAPSPLQAYTDHANPNNKASKLQGGQQQIGPGITLKVMAGDKVQAHVNSFFNNNGSTISNSNGLLDDIIYMMNHTIEAASSGKATLTQLETNNSFLSPVQSFLYTRNNGASTKPRAYLSYILFDERFQYIKGGVDVIQVSTNNAVEQLLFNDISITKNGYLYVFTSNETTNVDVFFDDFQVTHIRGPLLEETHYYPFGMAIAGISSKAMSFGEPVNKFKITCKEDQKNEFSDGSGLEWTDFGARMYDPQIGRWQAMDELAHKFTDTSPFTYVLNNPIVFKDFDGKDVIIHSRDGKPLARFSKTGMKLESGVDKDRREIVAYLEARNYLSRGGSKALSTLENSSLITDIYDKRGPDGSISAYQIPLIKLGSMKPNDKNNNKITDDNETYKSVLRLDPQSNGTIYWDFDYGLIDNQGNYHSPALLLDHEAWHAYHVLQSFVNYLNRRRRIIPRPYENMEEMYTIFNTNSTSMALNNGDGGYGQRFDHAGQEEIRAFHVSQRTSYNYILLFLAPVETSKKKKQILLKPF